MSRTGVSDALRGALIVAWAAAAGSAGAQSIEPRSYANAPVGVNFLIAGYGYAEGGVASDPSVPLTNASITVNGTFLAYARSLDVLGWSGKFDVELPYAWLSGSAEFAGQPHQRDVSGFGDPKFRLTVNFYGAPALSAKEFQSYQQDLIIGASLQVSAPLGQYDSDKLVNIGTNRWSAKPELGLSKAWGPWIVELAAGVTFYSDNTDFLGGRIREQDPIYSVQTHVIYNLSSGIWLAVDGTYYTGGRTTIDGVRGDDLQKNSRAGLTVAVPVDRNHSIKLNASTGVSTRTGSDFNAVGVAWQYRWGGGL